MTVAKYIYLPVTQDTKEGDSNGNHKKAYIKILFFFCYSILSIFWCISSGSAWWKSVKKEKDLQYKTSCLQKH